MDAGLDLASESNLHRHVLLHNTIDTTARFTNAWIKEKVELKFQSRSRVIKLFHRGAHGTSKRLLYTMLYHREGTLMNPNGRRLFEL